MTRFDYYATMTEEALLDVLMGIQAEMQFCRQYEPDSVEAFQAEINEIQEAILMHQVDNVLALPERQEGLPSVPVWAASKPSWANRIFVRVAKRLAGGRLFPFLYSDAHAYEDHAHYGHEGYTRVGAHSFRWQLSIACGQSNVMDSQHVSVQVSLGRGFRPILQLMYLVCTGEEPALRTGVDMKVAFGRLQYTYPRLTNHYQLDDNIPF